MSEERALTHRVPGELLPTMEKTVDPMQIFMFSAVTWNRHLIHYHPESAKGEGHRDVVVQRLLFGNFFEQYVKYVFGRHGELSRLSWKICEKRLPGDRLLFQGEVAETSPGRGEPDHRVRAADFK